ncbi:hypothetical protein A2U01_0072880, partial [Trifolium medium]|nr:hypothetical protein [Trifolium medium]
MDKIVSGMEEAACGAPQSKASMELKHNRPSSAHKEDRPLNVVFKQHPGSPVKERPLNVSGLWTSPSKDGQVRSHEHDGSSQTLKGDSVVSSTARVPRR